MAPPTFADLPKPARDVFTRGYNVGFAKAESTCRSGNAEMRFHAAHNFNSAYLFGGFDVKYKIPDYSTTVTERWNTDNVLSTEVAVDDKILKNMRMTIETSYAPYIGRRSGRVKGDYKADNATVTAEMRLDGVSGPIFNASAVGMYKNILFGYSTGFDPAKSKFTHNQVGICLENKDMSVHTYINNQKEIGAHLYHRMRPNVELAASMSWVAGANQQSRFDLGAKVDLDKDNQVSAKIDDKSNLMMAFSTLIKPGLKFTFSTGFNVQSPNEGAHKFGVGIECSQ